MGGAAGGFSFMNSRNACTSWHCTPFAIPHSIDAEEMKTGDFAFNSAHAPETRYAE